MKRGLFFTLASYLIWGLFPIYWKELSHVNAFESLAHRIFWGFVFVAAILPLTGGWREVRAIFSRRASSLLLLCSVTFMVINWFLFIWSVNHGQVLQASLGYYLSPLVNVLLGVIFLKERLSFWQAVAVGLALAGVLVLVAGMGEIPVVSLVLSFCFAVYALLRKIVRAEALTGLFVELIFIAGPALAYILWGFTGMECAFGTGDTLTNALLILAGPVTALPLIFFSIGARRLPLSTVGVLQYIPPTMQFFCGVFLFKEPFPIQQKICFGFIWAALALFSVANTPFMRHRIPLGGVKLS